MPNSKSWVWDVPKRPPYLWGIRKNAADRLEGFTCRVNAEFFVNYLFQSWLHSNPAYLAMIVNDFTVTKNHVDEAHKHFLCSQSSTIQFKTIYKTTGICVILIFKQWAFWKCARLSRFLGGAFSYRYVTSFPHLLDLSLVFIPPQYSHLCQLWALSMVQRLELRTVFRSLFLQ